MIRWIKDHIFYLIPVIIACLFFYSVHSLGRYIDEQNRFKIEIILEPQQLEKLEEISKKDFRDIKHTLLMLADDYIKYQENNEVMK